MTAPNSAGLGGEMIAPAFAGGGYEARSGNSRPIRGLGSIFLEPDGVRWVQRMPRFHSKFHPLVKWAPDELFIPFVTVGEARFAGGWWAPLVHIETTEAFYHFRIGSGYFMWDARRIGQRWVTEILRRRDALRGDSQ